MRRFRASLPGRWCEMAAFGTRQQASGPAAPGKATRGAAVTVPKRSFSVPAVAVDGAGEWEDIG